MYNYRIQTLTLSFLSDMILLGKIELSEIPAYENKHMSVFYDDMKENIKYCKN